MLDALASAAWKRPWALLGSAALLLGLLGALAVGSRGQLGHPRDDAAVEADLVVDATGGAGLNPQVLDVTLEAIRARIAAEPGVASVAPERGGDDRGAMALTVEFADTPAAEQRRIADELVAEIDPGPLEIRARGRLAGLLKAEDAALEDLPRLELLALPLIVLALLGALGARLAPGPVLCAGIAAAGALAGLGLAARALDVSLLAAVPAIAVGLALGVELAALLAGRWEDEIRLQGPRQALEMTVREGAPGLAWAGGAAALAAAALAAALAGGGLGAAAEMGAGAALAALLAPCACLLVMPALFALDGRREAGLEAEPRRDRRLAALLARGVGTLAAGPMRGLAVSLAAAAAAAALAVAALGLESRPLAAAMTPAGQFASTLPMAAAAMGVAIAAAIAVQARSPRALALGAVALLPGAAAIGLLTLAFADGVALFDPIVESVRVPTTGAIAAAVLALGAVASARGAIAAGTVRFERALDPGAVGVAERTAELTFPPAILGTVVAGAAFAALVGSESLPAQELGLMVAGGLLVDALLLRSATVVALARWLGPPRGGLRGRIRWPRWRRKTPSEPPTDSAS